MKAARAMVAVVLAVSVAAVAHAQRGPAEVLTNDSIISMTTANVNKDLMLAKINTTKNTFDVSVDGLVSLTTGKVNVDVIKSMISAAGNPKLGPAAPKTEVLDNQSIIKMVVSKVQQPVIIAKIVATKANFDVTSAGLVSLTQAKVPNNIVQAMIAKGGSTSSRP